MWVLSLHQLQNGLGKFKGEPSSGSLEVLGNRSFELPHLTVLLISYVIYNLLLLFILRLALKVLVLVPRWSILTLVLVVVSGTIAILIRSSRNISWPKLLAVLLLVTSLDYLVLTLQLLLLACTFLLFILHFLRKPAILHD